MAVSDIFNSMHWRGISNFGGLYMDARGEAGKAVSLNSVLLTGLAVKKLKAGVTEILVVMK